jgi:hypothetical protein
MQKSFIKSFLIAVVTALAVTLSPLATAQIVSSGMTGIVRGADGKAVAGAVVTAVHTPTNATFTATTNASGRYSFRGLPVGGPYTVTAKASGLPDATLSDVTTELGTDIEVGLTLKSDVVELEKLVIGGDSTELNASEQGTSNLFTRETIETKGSTQRSFADLVSTSPQVTLRSLSGDREEAQITALGQNNRYNSIMIDGNRINDQFGLNATGLASFFNPISFETIEQFNVITGTADVRYSGFTGATVNFVTKSGTNEFHGSAYYEFSGDHLAGLQMQGPDARTLVQSGAKVVPKLERTRKGFALGGPLWKDHLFFFINWEKFERIGAPNQAGLPTVAAADLAIITQRVSQISEVDYGSLGGNANSIADEEKRLVKLDWQINQDHRMTARYSTTEGQVPQFGSFTTTSFGSGLNNNSAFANLVGGASTSFDSHFYAQTREEKSLSAAVFSTWTPDFSTEVKWSNVKQDQYTPTASIAPEIRIFGVNGVNQGGASVANGVVVLGTERFRHGNEINVETKNYSLNADYHHNNITYSAGLDREENDYRNLFRQFSYGVFDFATPADFLADKPRFFQRNFTDLALKGDYAELSQYTQTGLYAKAKWDYSHRLNVTAGIRYDVASSDSKPTFNQQFLTDTGMRNDGTIDGASEVAPRIGFNWSLDEDRKTQIRGTAGYFVGRAPWVFFSNAYGNTGAGTFSSLSLPTGGLTGYFANNFDPASPYGTATQTGTSRAEINLNDDGIHMPSLWRFNIGLDRKLELFGKSTFSFDFVHSINDHTFFITNDNLKVAGTAADGRVYFVGNPSTAANARYANYTNIYHLRNVKAGESTYFTLQLDRPVRNKWGFNISYTRGKATEAQASGQTTASGMWQRNAVFNQSTQDHLFVETGRSDFEVRNRVQARFIRQFEFVKDWRSTAALYYEGRTGSPYSFAYSSDLNNDGFAGNDLYAVPTGPTDSRFDFSGLSQTQLDQMFAFIESSGLSKYAGGYAPKNAFYQPWVNRLDLKLTQTVPLHFRTAKLRLELDFTNLGTFISRDLFNYVERAPSAVNDVFERRILGNAAIVTATGKIRPTSFQTNEFLVDNTMSRWRVQVAAKLEY